MDFLTRLNNKRKDGISMFLGRYISKELQLKLIIALVTAVSLFLFIIYQQSTEKDHLIAESNLLLYQQGKIYEYEIRSELNKFTALSEILAVSFSKNLKQQDSKNEIKNTLRKLLYSNERLQSISLVLKMTDNVVDTSSFLLPLKDTVVGNYIRFNKTKSGISEDFTSTEYSSLSSKLAVDKTVEMEQVKILAPEIKQIDGKSISVIPIVSSLYFGKQYLGYLIMYISMDWANSQNDGFDGKLETFVSTGNGKVFALNGEADLLSEPISKLCFSCNNLLIENGNSYNASIEDNYITLCFPFQLEKNIDKWHICLRCNYDVLSDKLGYNPLYSWFFGLALYSLGTVLVFLFISRSEIYWYDLIKIANGILIGNVKIDDFKEEESSSKSALLKSLLLKIAGAVNIIMSSNKAVISGDYSGKTMENETQFEIIKSAKCVQLALSDSKMNLQKNQAELKQINEFNLGLEKITKVLQLHYKDLHQLCEKVTYCLVDFLEISMGAFYLMNKDLSEPALELNISYAYNEIRNQKKSFRMGESLIGACAAEQRTIFLKKIPENYLSIVSGLGLASPKNILIVPLLFESKVLGVIELGSLKDFDESKIKFVETAALSIANAVSLAQNNMMNSELLEKTRIQTIELADHDRKTIQALEDLKDLHKKTEQSEAAIRTKLEAMNNTLMMVEYTTQGILKDANYKFLNAMHYSIEEIRGINIMDILKEDERDELAKIIENVKSGNYYEGIIRRHTKLGHEKWFLATYTPVFNDQGTVEEILFFAVDITRIRLNELLLKKKNEELQKQVSDLRLLINK